MTPSRRLAKGLAPRREKNPKISLMAAAAENQRRRGRPTRLNAAVVDAIADRIAAGDTLAAACATAGVGERTLRAWRARAWSRRPEDRLHVELEQRLQAALLAHQADLARARQPEPLFESWEDAAAMLLTDHAERWADPDWLAPFQQSED
jgi:hypothetical protein